MALVETCAAAPNDEPTSREGKTGKLVTQFREILLWPLQLMPLKEGLQIHHHWELLRDWTGSPWEELLDEFIVEPPQLQERHYREFVTFLPHVQRVLYGEGSVGGGRAEYGESPIRVYRRKDIAQVRLFPESCAQPIVLDVAHVDLYFFYDTDVVILALEVRGDHLPLEVVQDLMFLFGRAYPPGWQDDGAPFHCTKVEWLGEAGRVLATSDFDDRDKFVASVCRHRAAAIAAHWEYLLEPMVPHHSGRKGALRYRQLEYYRMPLMVYLALDDPALTRAEYVRLAFATAPSDGETLPFSSRFLQRFETDYCYDRYFEGGSREGWCDTRCCVAGMPLS